MAIVLFLMADFFLSGWAISVLTTAALLYIGIPAIHTMWGLTHLERTVFLKAFVKTRRVQSVAFILFWLHSVRFFLTAATQANLINSGKVTTGMVCSGYSTTGLMGVFGWLIDIASSLSYLSTPVFIYAGACLVSVFLRSRLKASKEDPDLIKQRQNWAGACNIILNSAFIASVLSITLNPKGPVMWISNWLLASARDANLYNVPGRILSVEHELNNYFGSYNEMLYMPTLPGVSQNLYDFSFIQNFDNIVFNITSITLLVLLWKPAVRLHSFLTSFSWRLVSPGSLENIIEAFLEALHLPGKKLGFKEDRPLVRNAVRTAGWLVVCYLFLFWLFGFCGGPLGAAIQNWMIASAVDAGFGCNSAAPAWLFEPNYRIFIASVCALWGTPLFAVFSTVFLPFAKPRQLVINKDGMSFSQGPYLSLRGRQFRLWSDLESVEVKTRPKDKKEFAFKFRSGGRVKFSDKQITGADLKTLLNAIDQHSTSCSIAPEIFDLVNEDATASSGTAAQPDLCRLESIDFKSTIFNPHKPGDLLPKSKTRVSRQLASKPLCAVYAGRTGRGRMVNIKQFYLADETEETKAFSKILKREYELLSKLDHPGLAKVLDCYSVDNSTYLLIEFRPGCDLREIVRTHGLRSEAVTIKWAKQILEIMIYLHGKEPAILHRDLTPDNIIAGEDGQLRLIDFGAAREFLEGVTGTMIGKQNYVSPEQLRGEATVRSDIYSFGATLYFLLTGRDPIALSQSSPSSLVDVSAPLNQLIEDCTSFEEDERPQSFEEILERINSFDGGFRLKLNPKKEAVVKA